MRVAILGGLEVVGEHGADLTPVAAKERAIVSLLALRAGRTASVSELVDALWGEAPPPTAIKSLQSHVARLRRRLASDAIVRVQGGYRLRVEPEDVDAYAFEQLARRGRRLLGAREYEQAIAALDDALVLWGGEPLSDLGEAEVARAAAGRLCELAERANEDRVEARLNLGDHEGVIADVEQMVTVAPLRERRWAQLMLALYRCGRQADALRAYRRLRELLAEELGIEPSPELVSLDEAILLQKPELDWVPESPSAALNALPTGVVTFLLTDIEGSTQLWEANATGMAAALQRHDGVIHHTVLDHRGVLLKAKGEGDSTLSVFRRASDAAGAAFALNALLEEGEWPGELRLRVRIGVHTGEAYERDGDYYGPTLNRAARIRALAQGGQVLTSTATAELVQDHLPSDAALVDMGQHQLRGLSRTEHVFLLTDADSTEVQPRVVGETGVPLPRRVTSASVDPELFVGRDAELEQLMDRLKAASQEARPQVVLVNGEPGIGKTSLAATFARFAHDQGAAVLYGAGDEDLASPYQPWRDMLCHLIEHAPAHLDPVLTDHAGQLATLGIGSGKPEPGSSDPETARYLLFGAVIAVLTAVAEPSGLVVVLEDLHWADTHSLQLLRHLLATKPQARVLVVGTFRDADATPSSPLATLVARLHRESGMTRLDLQGLGETELTRLLEASTGSPLNEPGMVLRDTLLAETDGNPFFVVEMLRHLAETGAIYQERTARGVPRPEPDLHSLPVSVREVIRERVARLGDVPAAALSTASVMGRDFDLGVLAAATETTKRQVLNSLEAAASASLITDLGQERFSFAHALIGQVLYARMSPTRRALAHRMVADALEEHHQGDPDRAGELALHFAKASSDHSAKALHYAHRAADHALASLAPDDAQHWYREALAVLEKRPEPDEALDCELRIGLGTAQRQCGDPAHRQTLLDAARQAITLDDTELLARAALANSRGSFSVAGGVDHERIEVLRAACRAAEGTRGATEAQLLAVLGTELSFAGTYGERQETSNRALAIARELGDPRTLLAVLNHRFTTIRVPPTLEERLSQAAEAAKLAALTDDPLLQLHAAADRYQTAWEAANRPEIERTWPILQEGAERLRQPFFDFLIRSHASHEAWVVGDLDESERLANEMLGSGKESGQPDAPTWFWVHLIEIRREQDRIEELIPTIESAALEFPKIPGIQLLLARCYCDVGRLDEARTVMVDHVAEDFSALGWDPTWLPSVCQGADAVVDLGWPEASEKLLPLIHPYCAQFATNMGFCTGPVARSVGRLLATIGRMDEAERCFSASEQMSETMRSPLFAAHTHLDWGRSLAATGRPQSRQGAGEHLAQALELAEKHRFTYIARRAMSLGSSVESSRGDCAVEI